MPKFIPLQKSFAAGEVTDRMLAQFDSDAYKQGYENGRNFITMPQGPATTRGGLRVAGKLSGEKAVGFGFPVTRSMGFGVQISTDYISIVTPYAKVRDNDIPSWKFHTGSGGWSLSDSGDGGYATFTYGSCMLVPPTGSTGYIGIYRSFTPTHNNKTTRLQIYCDPDLSDAPMRVMVGTGPTTGDVYDSGYITSSFLDVEYEPGGNATLYVAIITAFTDGVALSRRVHELRSFSVEDSGPLLISHPWGIDDLDFIQADMPPGLDHMYFVHPNVAPQRMIYDRTTDAWTFGALPLTSSPWSGSNYPGSICFFQGRCWMGGEPNNPEGFWGSKSGIYTDFSLGTGLADEAIQYTMAKKGAIQWMAGAKNLLIGTTFGEHIVTSEGNILKTGDINADQQSAFGSSPMQSVTVGTKVLYASADGRKVRDMGYKWTDAGWVSRDITFTSEHLTKNSPVKRIAFCQNPNNLIIATTYDDKILTATYERTNNIVGWHKHETYGRVLACFVIPQEGKDHPVFITARGEATQTMHTEVMDDRITLDHAYEMFFPVPTSTIYSPQHLSKTVSVIVDGAMHNDIILDANGQGTVDWECSHVQIGTKFTQYLKTLPLGQTVEGLGSSSAMMVRWVKIYLRIIDSYRPKINGQRPPVRHPDTPMTQVEPAATEDIKVANLGWTKDGSIEIEQDLPLRTTIGGIYGEVAAEML